MYNVCSSMKSFEDDSLLQWVCLHLMIKVAVVVILVKPVLLNSNNG